VTVADLGAGTDPDPRADVTVDAHQDADIHADLTDDWPFDDGELEGVVMTHVLEHLPDTQHVFSEAGRVLHPGGWLDVTVPVGADIRADPTHEHAWTYSTPTAYCQRESEPWQPDTAFVLVERDLDVWLFPPFRRLSPVLQAFAGMWPAEACRRATSGELTARYRRRQQ